MSHTLGDDELVLVIATTDDWLHAGTVSEVLEHARWHRDGTGHPGGPDEPRPEHGRLLDVFDAQARRVQPVLDERFEVGALIRPDEEPDPEVRYRIERVLDLAQEFLDESPQGAAAAVRWPVGVEVPRPDGSFEDVVAALGSATNVRPNAHSAGWFHNLLHAMRG